MFEFSPDARFEFLHPADAGVAFARAVACEESIGETLYIAGGAGCRMTYYDFTTALMSAIGIGPIPIEAFVRTKPARFFGDWVDTEESQRLLQYQKRGLDEQLEDMKKDLGKLVPLIRLVRPLATWFVTRSSRLSQGEPPFACRLTGRPSVAAQIALMRRRGRPAQCRRTLRLR